MPAGKSPVGRSPKNNFQTYWVAVFHETTVKPVFKLEKYCFGGIFFFF